MPKRPIISCSLYLPREWSSLTAKAKLIQKVSRDRSAGAILPDAIAALALPATFIKSSAAAQIEFDGWSLVQHRAPLSVLAIQTYRLPHLGYRRHRAQQWCR